MTDICQSFFQLSRTDKGILRRKAQDTFHWTKATFYRKVRTGGERQIEREFFLNWFAEYHNNKLNIDNNEQDSQE